VKVIDKFRANEEGRRRNRKECRPYSSLPTHESMKNEKQDKSQVCNLLSLDKVNNRQVLPTAVGL